MVPKPEGACKRKVGTSRRAAKFISPGRKSGDRRTKLDRVRKDGTRASAPSKTVNGPADFTLEEPAAPHHAPPESNFPAVRDRANRIHRR